MASAQPVVQVEPVVVSEAPLGADAVGIVQLRVADTAPASTQTLADVVNTAANVHVDAGGAGSFGSLFTVRGLTNTPYFSDPSVAVYFDDIPLGNAFSFPTGLFGFATVTIARGPQPAAFGRAAEGGVITFASPTPGPQAAGELRLGFGNYDLWTAALEARSARTDRADATVAGSFQQRNGYITNTQLGTRVDDQRHSAGTARVRVRPTSTSEITLDLLGSRIEDGAQPLVPIGGPLFTVSRGREGTTDSTLAAGALKIAFDTTLGRLSATTSRTVWTLDPYDNRLVLPPTLDSQLTQSQRAWNEELRLTSDPKSSWPWQVGAWYSAATTAGDVHRAIPGLFPIEASSFTLNSHTAAVFGETSIPLSADWVLTAGARAEEIKRNFDRKQTVPGPGEFAGDARFDALMPKVSVRYSITPETHASASVGFATKPGGWSAYTDKAALAGFDPEKTVAFEAGVDTLLAARTVKVGARVFDYEIRDYQIERSFNATDYLVVNAPRARSVGAEVEAYWHPAGGLSFNASAGVTNATLRRFVDPFTGVSYAGRRAPYVPDYNATVGVTERWGGGWFVSADADATGRTFYEESEDPRSLSRAHIVFNARAGYDTPQWRVTVFSENLDNTAYTTLLIPGVNHEVPGAPRTYGIEAAYKW